MKRESGRRRTFFAVVVAGLASLVLLAGCSAISSLIDTQQALQNAGYQSVNVSSNFGSGENTVDVSVTVSAYPSPEDVQQVAQVVWQQFHLRFAFLNVTIHGQGTSVQRSFTFGDLQSAFGPRDPAWNSTSLHQATDRLVIEIVVGVAVVGLLVVVTILGIVRRRRRNRAFSPYSGYSGAPQTWAPAGSPGLVGPPPGAPEAPGAPLWPPPPYPPRPLEPPDAGAPPATGP